LLYAQDSVLPNLAPLSEAMAEHWTLRHHLRNPTTPVLRVRLDDQLNVIGKQFDEEWGPIIARAGEEATAIEQARAAKLRFSAQEFYKQWAPLITEVNTVKWQAYELLSPAIERKEHLTNEQVAVLLREHTPHPKSKSNRKNVQKEGTLVPQTISRWRTQGLLYGPLHQLAFNAVWAVLIMRLLEPELSIGFLPPGDHRNEPVFHCWRQDAPDAPIVSCGLPLDRNPDPIPRHAFLFSDLPTLGQFDRSWKPLGGWSFRWAGIKEEDDGVFLWDLTEDEIALWNPRMRPHAQGVLDAYAHLVRHDLANTVLIQIASQHLSRVRSTFQAAHLHSNPTL
jgi:hypothetical protein